MARVPTVATGRAAALGAGGITINGDIHPHGLHTTYRVEYGPTIAYPSATEEVVLPPRLGAHYHESWEKGFAGWPNLFECAIEHRRDGKASQGYIRYTEQQLINDFNHDATGVVHVMTGLYTGKNCVPEFDYVALGGGDADLRGARISMWIRGVDWRPNGSEFVYWVQHQINPEVGDLDNWQGHSEDRPGRRRANWVYNGFYMTDYLLDGEWHKVELTLTNDSDLWSYCGNNRVQQQDRAARYSYWPLDGTLGHNNVNILMLSAYVDPHNPPTGSIDFDEFSLTYRNRSLIFPGNGGELVGWPQDSPDDPATLTDGWRNGQGRVWRSVQNPVLPQEFTYSFSNQVTVEAAQLHNNPDWPGKDVEVLISSDGRSYDPLGRYVLPEKSEPTDNFAFVVADKLAVRGCFLKVRLTSGYRTRHWGLGEIEVFGSGARMPTDDERYAVNVDVNGLEIGQTYHYRLVATNDEGAGYGEDRDFTVPATLQPLVETGLASAVTATTARLEGRLNPMGTPTYYFFQYGTDTGYDDTAFSNFTKATVGVHRTQSSERINLPVPGSYSGIQITTRTVLSNLGGLNPGTRYHYRLVAISQYGVAYGDDATLKTLT